MNAKMIKQWAAVAALACITMGFNALADTTLIGPVSLTLKANNSEAQGAQNFSNNTSLASLLQSDNNTLKLSFDIKYGTVDGKLNSWSGYAPNGGATLSVGFLGSSNRAVAYALIDLDSNGGSMSLRERDASGIMMNKGSILGGTASQTFTAANAPVGNTQYHYDLSITKTAGTTATDSLYTLTFSDGVNLALSIENFNLAYDGDILKSVSFRLFNTFNNNDDSKYNPSISNLTVSVIAVPEPSALMLFGSGIALLAAFAGAKARKNLANNKQSTGEKS